MEQRIQELMKTLDITRDEALQLIADDEAIDKGAKMFDLSPEAEKASKAARQVGRKAGTPNKRERKEDNDKRFLIDTIVWALTTDIENAGDNPQVTDLQITNPEREIVFTHNGRKFKVVLSAPRT
jgi:hypothetical protein